MATSETSICNISISYLGGNQIISLEDSTPEAGLCKANYAACRDAVLEEVNWTFATKRFKLGSPLVIDPVYGYSKQFELPPEVLRVIEVDVPGGAGSPAPATVLGVGDIRYADNPSTLQWTLEGRHILCNANSIVFLAVVRVTDPALFSPGFVQALAARIATEICLPLTNSKSHYEAMAQMYIAKLQWASAQDGRQGINQVRRISDFVR